MLNFFPKCTRVAYKGVAYKKRVYSVLFKSWVTEQKIGKTEPKMEKTLIFQGCDHVLHFFFIRNRSIRNRLSGNFGAKKLSPTLVLGSKIHKKLFKK